MKNEKLEAFLHANRLKSADLVKYWGVTKGVVSQILNGATKLPTKRLEELLNNPYGWDVSMLKDRGDENVVEEKPAQDEAITTLLGLLAEKDKDIRTLIEMLKKKDEQIDELREELDARKRGTAPSVVHSSAADAI